MDTRIISIAKEFSRFPGGRFTMDGPYPGEKFRDGTLAPALQQEHQVIVLLDGTLGYGSSFLEEAFGGLVRLRNFSADELHSKLVLKSEDSSLLKEVWEYIDSAKPSGGK